MGLALIYSLCLAAGLLLLFRDRWLRSLGEAQSEAEARFRDILDKQRLEEVVGASPGKTAEELQEKSILVNSLSRRLDQSDLLRNEEGRSFLEMMQVWLIRAGWAERFTPTQALSYALIIWSIGVVLPIFFYLSFAFPPLFLLALVVPFSATYPVIKLRGAIRERQDTIRAEVPFFIQQLYMTLSTGMATIDEAIVRVGKTSEEDPYDSILAAEFGQAQAEYRLGAKTFEDAIRDIAYRTGVHSVDNLCEALVQGYSTGAELDKTLIEYSQQAQEMWRQDMREYKNRKEPIVTIALVISMFGAFIIWATPLAVQFMQTLAEF